MGLRAVAWQVRAHGLTSTRTRCGGASLSFQHTEGGTGGQSLRSSLAIQQVRGWPVIYDALLYKNAVRTTES